MHHQANHSRRGISTTGVVLGATALVIVVAVAFLGGGNGSTNLVHAGTDLHEVTVGTFDVSIPASGELAAHEQVELRCELDGMATITEIVDEGSPVQVGDVLVRLDDKDVRERIQSAEESVVAAQNQVETRTADYAIAQKSRESNLAKSRVTVDQNKLALLAWREGEVVAKRNQLALALRTAEKDFKRLEEKYKKSLELRERDFISQNDLEQDEIQMIRAEAQLSQARLDQQVYEKYTYEKDKQRRESDLQQAVDELERVETRTAASVLSAKSNLDTAKSNLGSKEDRLAQYQQQLVNCTVKASASGMVVYGTTIGGGSRWDQTESLRVGSKVSRNQVLIVLPNTDRMFADVKVNEALSGHVEQGQPATIRMDAFSDRVLQGQVDSVGVLAEDGGWRDPNRRDYSVKISISNSEGLPLKPSMRCQALILVDTVTDALFVPVQSVHRGEQGSVVYLKEAGSYRPTPVSLGRSSELYVEILDGVVAGDRVLLRDPPAGTVLSQKDVSRPDTD
jgi:multidrug efflux pump subunit AcrA (membrane-fusion protein)